MNLATVALAVACLSGCASLAPVDDRSAEQIRASAADRSIRATCVLVTTPWGPQRTTIVEMDRASIVSGRVRATPECIIEIVADPKAEKVPQ